MLLHAAATAVKWREGLVELEYMSKLTGEKSGMRRRQLIVTVPLGVLQADAPRKRSAAEPALDSLARILKRKIPRPEAFYFHDWRRDPQFRGAYSYVPVDGLWARDVLSKPVQRTLYFAGEATNRNGHGGTVHGAMASGLRAAQLVQKRATRSAA